MIGAATSQNDPLAPRDPKNQELFEDLFERISEVSSLPTVAVRIAEVANDPSTCAAELYEVVQSDPAIAARIIRSVNSAYFGLRQSVADLKTAITMLGFREVRNLALTFYVSQLFEETPGYKCYTRTGLWDHMVCVGTAARLLSERRRKAQPEEAYLAGLLHDLGLILIDQSLHDHMCRVVDQLSEDAPTWQAEMEVLHFHQAELGEYAARKWLFPEQIADAIRFHDFPQHYEGPNRELVDVVSVANYLCSRRGHPALGIHNVPVPHETVFSNLGISREELSSIWHELEDTLARAEILAKMTDDPADQ